MSPALMMKRTRASSTVVPRSLTLRELWFEAARANWRAKSATGPERDEFYARKTALAGEVIRQDPDAIVVGDLSEVPVGIVGIGYRQERRLHIPVADLPEDAREIILKKAVHAFWRRWIPRLKGALQRVKSEPGPDATASVVAVIEAILAIRTAPVFADRIHLDAGRAGLTLTANGNLSMLLPWSFTTGPRGAALARSLSEQGALEAETLLHRSRGSIETGEISALVNTAGDLLLVRGGTAIATVPVPFLFGPLGTKMHAVAKERTRTVGEDVSARIQKRLVRWVNATDMALRATTRGSRLNEVTREASRGARIASGVARGWSLEYWAQMESASSADLARLLTAPNGAPADVIEAWLVTGRAPVRSVGDTCRHAGLVIADRALRIRQYVAGRIRRIRRR